MRRSIGAMCVVAAVGLALTGCGKKKETAPPIPPAKTTTPATPAKEQAANPAPDQAAQQLRQTAIKVKQQAVQEANQVQAAAGTAALQAQQAVMQAAAEQTTCPVMGGAIDKTIFVEYKGKKVYFCCESCKAAFEKDPEKYVKDLPQFKQ